MLYAMFFMILLIFCGAVVGYTLAQIQRSVRDMKRDEERYQLEQREAEMLRLEDAFYYSGENAPDSD